MTQELTPGTPSPFETIRRVIEDARTACFSSGQRVDDHFVEITDMIPSLA